MSRLSMHGPAGELCDLIYVPISSAAGLEHVHPTWAGTFVLAALVFLFPGVHFVLLDSDCVPVTLFEVADLWKEISLLHKGLTQANASCPKGPVSGEPRESVPKASKLSHGRWQHQIIGQGVLMVTEHNAEVNAGFIVAFASSHRTAVTETRWRRMLDAIGTVHETDVLAHEANRLANLYWNYINDFLDTRRPLEEIDSVECAAWVQTGLALTPFAGCVAKYTCDWTVAWSLIGEWTSQEVFLPPAGEWPRNGHSKNLVEDFDFRRPPILTWARACFEQGSLPSLLHLAGSALLSVLPGDRMFQAQRLLPGFTRPVILHGYGGAKHDIRRTLPLIAAEGWVPFAHAMVGYLDKLPAWCQDDLRPVLGTSCDFRIHPDPLTRREQLLLLSMWRRIRVPCLPSQCALRTWLANKVDIPVTHGPDHEKSPHAYGVEVDYETLFKGLAIQAATVAPEGTAETPTKEQLLALRMVAYGLSTDHLELLTSLLLGGRMPFNFLHDHWNAAVQDYLDGKPLLEVFTVQSFKDMVDLLPTGRQSVLLIDKLGKPLTDRAVTSLRFEGGKGVDLPVDMHIVHEAAPDRKLPDLIRIDCSGLGGHDLGGPLPWHICVRTDRHGQNIYGPSLATLETTLHRPKHRPLNIVALGLTKAMHEFLALHYFAIDSAAGWDKLLRKRLPEATLCQADARRQCALEMFEKSHIAPSYRRLPHPSWTTCLKLLLDLLIGAGKTRYLGTRPHARQQREVLVRGFSAGSYSGICLLHLLWQFPCVEARGKLGGIACPPELLRTIPADKGQGVQLFHYEKDLLCCWQPTFDYINRLHCSCTIVTNDQPDLHDHFGKSEHSYGHWIELPIQAGWFQLWRFLQLFPDAADPKLRDVTPLRLMSWLSCQLSERTKMLIKECMAEFSRVEPVHSDKITQIGKFHLPGVGNAWATWDHMRDAVIDEITVRGHVQQPVIVTELIRGFLQRLPLPRLLHFVDLVLPQMVPVSSPAQSDGAKFPGSQLIRDLWIDRDKGQFVQEPNVKIMRLFHSHANMEHFRVDWNNHPLLLFADMETNDYANVWSYQRAKAVTTTRQNITMGLKKGNTVLLHFQYQGQFYQAILMMADSIPGSKGGVGMVPWINVYLPSHPSR